MHQLDQLYKTVEQHPRRFKRAEKEAFIDETNLLLEDWNYKTTRTECKSKFWTSVHLETEVEEAEFIFMAHYDTPTMLPPWIELLSRLFGQTRPLLLSLAIGLMVVVPFLLPGTIALIIGIVLSLSLLLLLVPNPKNLNDNTSGVLGLLHLAEQLKDSPSARKKVKFVLVDNEEMMLVGSTQLRDHWEGKGFDFERSRIVCLDCIGWGDVPVIIRNGVSYVGNELIDIFREEQPESQLLNLGLLPLNDNYVFRDAGAVLVSRMKKTWWKGGFYIPNIHSVFDKRLDMNQIEWVVRNLLVYLKEEKVVRKRKN